MVTAKRAAELVLERERAKHRTLDYIRYMRPESLPDFHHEPARHHRLFADELDRLTDGLLARNEEDDRSAVSVPPGAAKSFYYSIVSPTRALALNPTWKIICVSAAESLAEDFARRRRQIMLTPRWQRLSGTSLLSDAKSLSFQGTKEGGGIYAVGAGSTIQGLRADMLFGDDLVSGFEQAGSLAQLDKLWNWYLSEARSRLKPGGAEIMIATRWALLDPIGRALRLTEEGAEKWHYLRIPMECDSDADPVGRKLGERLWPEYFTPRMVQDAKRNPLIWNTLYQQNPAVSEHTWVSLDHIHVDKRQNFPEDLRYYIGCDVALSVGKGDFTVFAVIGIDSEKRFYLVDLYRKQVDPAEATRAYLALQQQYKPRYAWVENDNNSVTWGRMVQLEARRQGMASVLRLSALKNRDKETRAANLRSLFMQDRVVIADAPWTQAALREIAEFPDGRNDDIIDGMGVVAKEVHHLSGPATISHQPVEKPIEGAFQYVNGQIKTRQTFKELLEPVNVGKRRARI